MSFKTLWKIVVLIVFLMVMKHTYITEDGIDYTKKVRWGVFGLIFIGAIVMAVTPYIKTFWLTKCLSSSDIATADDNLVEVEGMIGCDVPIVKDISSIPYIYHYEKVWKNLGRKQSKYIIKDEEVIAGGIYVEDATGRMYLDHTNIDFKLRKERTRTTETMLLVAGDSVKVIGKVIILNGRKTLVSRKNKPLLITTASYLKQGNEILFYSIQALFPLLFAGLFSWVFLNSDIQMHDYQLSLTLLNDPRFVIAFNISWLSYLIDLKMNQSPSYYYYWGLILTLGIFIISPIVLLLTKISLRLGNYIGFLMLIVFNLWPTTIILLLSYHFWPLNIYAFWLTWICTFISTFVVRYIQDR